MDKNADSIDAALENLMPGFDEDSRAEMSQAELLAELLYKEKTDDPLGDF